jgi:phage/plasmid-like protein (TIGR03299 family)
MAHELDFSRGRAACMVTGEAAWHRLGVVIEKAATSEEAIKLAELDFPVDQCEMFASQKEGGSVWVPDAVANVRRDTGAVLGVVGRRYRVFQNAEAFDFMDSLVGEKLAMYETAGALKGGRRVWMMARIPKEYRVGDDVVHPYVLLTNSHDGSQALRMIPTTVRVVCQNTLNLALSRASGGLRIMHTQSLKARVADARRNLGIIMQRHDRFGEEMKALAAKPLASGEAEQYFRKLFPQETYEQRQRNADTYRKILRNFDNPRNTLPGIKHTAWAAYNAVSEWADHDRKAKGKTATARDDNRLHSIWFGAAAELKQNAWELALTLAV